MSEAVDTLDNKNRDGRTGVGEFVRETREELNKTTFPSGEVVKSTTLIVIINVIFFAVYLFLVDRMWSWLLEGLTWLINKLAGI